MDSGQLAVDSWQLELAVAEFGRIPLRPATPSKPHPAQTINELAQLIVLFFFWPPSLEFRLQPANVCRRVAGSEGVRGGQNGRCDPAIPPTSPAVPQMRTPATRLANRPAGFHH